MLPIDILYLTLSVCVAMLTIFLSITLVYLLFILRDITKISDQVKDIVEKVDTYVTKPILLTKSIIEFVAPFVRTVEEKVGTRKKR